MTRFVIREALQTDLDDIVTFYQEFPDSHVMLRTEAAVRTAIRNGTFFLGIDTSATNAGRIFAASAVYDVEAILIGGGTMTLKEAGGSNVKEDRRGFGIHQIMHAARAMHEFILDRGGFHEYFGAIIVPNDPSVKNIMRMGFEKWQDVPPSLRAEREPYVGEGNNLEFYRLLPQSLPLHAKKLIETASRSLVENRHGELKQVELVLDIETVRKYMPILERVADNDISEILRP